MSVSITRGEGVTVLTLNTDSSSVCPPLCQIFKGLCYNPVCCSVSQQLRVLQKGSQSMLGALNIMTGLISIGLAVILCVTGQGYWWYMDYTGFPFWLGGVFVAFGIMSILSEKFPSPCLVIINVILQLSGVCFAIASIVLYAINIADTNLWNMCNTDYDYGSRYDFDDYGGRHLRTTASPSPEEKKLKESCLEAKQLTMMLLLGINGVLILLSVLELCVTISASVLGIKALKNRGKNIPPKCAEDVEDFKPLME
ncbi:unnamed protein product [Ophioblennius macclurei]